MGADCIKILYKSLKLCLTTENDDVTIYHCALAVDALDKVTKDLFTPNGKLEKKIFVLDAPR